MEKQEAKSKWDELVRQLGAEVTPEAEQLVEVGPAPPVEPVSSTRTSGDEGVEQPPAAPKRPAAGWDNLASEFGLPAPPEPVKSASEEVVEAKKQPVASRSVGAERPRREREGGDRPERHDKRRERRDESREATQPRRERPDRSRRSPKFRDRSEIPEEESHAADAPPAERNEPAPKRPHAEEPKPAPVENRPKAGPAVSLWHKIFGSPADQSAKIEEISARPDDEITAQTSREEQSLTRDTDIDGGRAVDDQVETRERDEFESQFERGIEPDVDSEQVEQGERRPRRPRRRRRGRGGRGESGLDAEKRAGRSQHRKDDAQPDGDDFDQSDEDEDEFSDSLETSDSTTGDAGDVEGEENGAQRSGRSRASLQRSIPSWDEAIGFIVDANMQSRSQRRPSGPSGSRGGPPRGRSRGRRRN